MMKAITVREVIGKNVRRIRNEHNVVAERLAIQMQHLGFKWTTSRVSEVERGRKAISIEELLCLTFCLGVLTRQPIRLSDLWEGAHLVEAGSGVGWEASSIAAFMAGQPVHGPDFFEDHREGSLVQEEESSATQPIGHDHTDDQDYFGVAERRAQKRFNLTSAQLQEAMTNVWGHSLTTERDSRSAHASAQTKGHITRALLAELEAYLEDNIGRHRKIRN